MSIGEKLWVGEGKTDIMIVKGINADGVTVEFTWSGNVKGVGKAEGVNGSIVFTGTKIAPFNGYGKGKTTGQGIFFSSEGMVAIQSAGYGNPKWEQNKSVELWDFMTTSKILEWLSNCVAVVTQEGDPAWKEFKIVINEWISKNSK